ncbi:MAG: methylated-DNA--[protein]-cysteine S-methyltransferase [Candidatus Heimdallarchaeota archaeon]|nr:methylated-DNA--[protein]-cysteine S-methyltransferase [Candidatus Heimdallarchaeota archaeon]
MKIVISKHNEGWTGILLNNERLFYSHYSFKNKDEAVNYLSKIAGEEVIVEEKNHPYIDVINGIIDGTSFDLPKINLDFSGFTDKESDVLKALLKIPAGEVVSYAELGKRAGIPNAARFVGNVMAKNRFGPIVPCHRVILSDGRMGKFSGKENHPMKKKMLTQEKAKFRF